MWEGKTPVKLPEELVKFYSSIHLLQQEIANQNKLSSASLAPPANWVWQAEIPAIFELKPNWDWPVTRQLFQQLLSLLVTYQPRWAGAAEKLQVIPAVSFTRLMEMTIARDVAGVNQLISSLGSSPEVANFALSQTAQPFLRIFAAQVRPQLSLDNWRQSFCPVCGHQANAAWVDGIEGKRYLRCAQCHTEWPFKLLACPDCGNEDHRKLTFLQIAATSGYGIHVCEVCRGYIKAIDEKRGGHRDLLNDEVTTIYLDVMAQQLGYRLGGIVAQDLA